jgi:hypothetical protein
VKLISVALAALLLVLVTASAIAAAKEQTCVAAVKVTVPVIGKTMLGTVVTRSTGSSNDMTVAWAFTGAVNGTPASSSGHATAKWSSSYRGTITSIDTWDMGGLPRPVLPLGVSLADGSKADGVILSLAFTKLGTISLPLSVQGLKKLPPPFKGDVVVNVTNIAGKQTVTVLPPAVDGSLGPG